MLFDLVSSAQVMSLALLGCTALSYCVSSDTRVSHNAWNIGVATIASVLRVGMCVCVGGCFVCVCVMVVSSEKVHYRVYGEM